MFAVNNEDTATEMFPAKRVIQSHVSGASERQKETDLTNLSICTGRVTKGDEVIAKFFWDCCRTPSRLIEWLFVNEF